MAGRKSIRIPIHGFVELDDWELDIVNHSVFQRLRRIRQLAFSEHIYPGSTHTRFEHSLGVLHIATRLFDTLRAKHESMLQSEFGFNDESFARSRRLVRLSALLHDVGHGPFSHSSEDLMPIKDGRSITHEDCSAWLIREAMTDVIDDHPVNQEGLHITGREIADFYRGKPEIVGNKRLLWRDLVDGQIDADRMDYLLRDSHHAGVAYGAFDLDRVIDTIAFVKDLEDSEGGIRIGIESGGMHAAEGLILARYFMFTQVYFHKTRLAYDKHASECLRLFLGKTGRLPDPSTASGRTRFLKLDDWSVAEFVKKGKAGRHGEALLHHHHDRLLLKTSEVAKPDEIERHENALAKLAESGIEAWEADADKSWYKGGLGEIQVGTKDRKGTMERGQPLAECSEVVGRIRDSSMRLLFAPVDQRAEAESILLGLG